MISRISPSLMIGDWNDAKAISANPDVVIVTVAKDSPFIGNYYFPMVDGKGGDWENARIFWAAVTKVRELQGESKQVLVHCVSGISRSVSVVIARLMDEETGYHLALRRIQVVRPIANPHPFFVKLLT